MWLFGWIYSKPKLSEQNKKLVEEFEKQSARMEAGYGVRRNFRHLGGYISDKDVIIGAPRMSHKERDTIAGKVSPEDLARMEARTKRKNQENDIVEEIVIGAAANLIFDALSSNDSDSSSSSNDSSSGFDGGFGGGGFSGSGSGGDWSDSGSSDSGSSDCGSGGGY